MGGRDVKTTKEVKPNRPRVDRGVEFEQLLRPMFSRATDIWCKENLEEQPSKDQKGNVVDNLVASFSSAFETFVDASTDSYLSTVTDDGDEDDDEDGDEDESDEDEDVVDIDED